MNTPLQFATLIEAFNTSSAAKVCIHEDKHGNYPIYDGFCGLCFDQNAQWRHRSCRTSAIHQGQEETVIGARLEIGSSPSSGGLRRRDQRRNMNKHNLQRLQSLLYDFVHSEVVVSKTRTQEHVHNIFTPISQRSSGFVKFTQLAVLYAH